MPFKRVSIKNMISLMRMRQEWHAAHMEEMRNAQRSVFYTMWREDPLENAGAYRKITLKQMLCK
jgi:hypothetical protein